MPDNLSPVWRVIDANLNRFGEGLRVIEDIARLIVEDAEITEKLKTIRHQIVRGTDSFNTRLIDGRESESDVGVNLEVKGESKTRSLPALLVANSRRAQESLRVLEEMARLGDLQLDSTKYQQSRFEIYEIEKTLYSRLLRKEKLAGLTGLYVIIDANNLYGRTFKELAEATIRGGARTIQLRDKTGNKRAVLAAAVVLREICSANNAMFIVNDFPDIAKAAGADGLHVGQEDLPAVVARRQIPIDMLLGCSASTVEEAVQAEKDGSDYVGLGSVYPTDTKLDVSTTGLDILRETVKAVHIPVVAIGGINKQNIGDVMAAGACAAAVISAVAKSDDPETAARELTGKINE